MKFLKQIYRLWIKFGLILSFISTRILLTLLFYLIITPLGLIGKLFDKQFLNLKRSQDQKSYWVLRTMKILDSQTYERQF
ncbi:MAG: hypothetical protein A2W61_00785 [Deltaproteobacteria bacterium RIFCSPLOWO2_01_44_7]|nr:MAG: hypothetical protein A2712_05780 [Deltaproteobacteria bacterium RIFCSPHIGHO2_01_FULL_43_49]OGQ16641.1 MAG: hypothetical protein A3D22_06905 [Deltaproteobacteria bacterium RIFCSPHIGHO2_02_FULL_44_53]OGQ29779.1 MAG: hypothetical protein A3D98_09570 [Deltaproteobacteria bacterium RIFCSPHIGHO2_12_FULL_44_21]OGQ33069.1 MAG: hypothetical protein A2979_03550 [Deltaproteobacteria bacterium RIFCSPLOWO2_01_FULL_45_74]OGQ37942.1 MAG: hypothetical protein A2W61_00785 [Deltaproteobacteria bacterium 